MNASVPNVEVTLKLAEPLYQRVSQLADQQQVPLEELLLALLIEGVQAFETEKLWSKLAESYRDRLSQSGKLDQNPKEILKELAIVREQVANKLYPD